MSLADAARVRKGVKPVAMTDMTNVDAYLKSRGPGDRPLPSAVATCILETLTTLGIDDPEEVKKISGPDLVELYEQSLGKAAPAFIRNGIVQFATPARRSAT